MTTILRVDASARRQRSLTRLLGDLFVEKWLEADPAGRIITRDVGLQPPPAISETWIAGAFKRPDERTAEEASLLALSDRFIAELERADILLIATPMYNYGLPAALKAWVDQVVRIGKTFTFDLARGDRPLEPVLSGKTLVLLTASGEFGFEPGGLNDGRGHLVPHVETISGYLGVDAMHHIGIEYQEFGDARFAASKAAAMDALRALVRRLAEAQHGPEALAS